MICDFYVPIHFLVLCQSIFRYSARIDSSDSDFDVPPPKKVAVCVSSSDDAGADLEGGFGGLQPPQLKPWRPTVNSAQEFKFIIRYARGVQYNLSAKRKQAYTQC